MAEMPPLLSSFNEVSKDEVIKRLQLNDTSEMLARLPPLQTRRQRAAVLLPIFYRNSKLHILLTVRSDNLRSHGGEVALPGGKCDDTDGSFEDTALRESDEEIGLPRDTVEVISQLGLAFAKAGTLVIPIVGFIPGDFNPIPNPAEVQDVFSVPLSQFLKGDNHFKKTFTDMTGHNFDMHFFSHSEGDKNYTVFGLTAYICILAASICFARAPEFPMDSDFDPPTQIKLQNCCI